MIGKLGVAFLMFFLSWHMPQSPTQAVWFGILGFGSGVVEVFDNIERMWHSLVALIGLLGIGIFCVIIVFLLLVFKACANPQVADNISKITSGNNRLGR